ncbi:MAG TPA: SdrD B-like domain-containing protein [bacterium]|nr:SdrD B-like domain-containing protein [bacterium]HQJ65393.1 SdrD B-like domain-containing protein [bacterium]
MKQIKWQHRVSTGLWLLVFTFFFAAAFLPAAQAGQVVLPSKDNVLMQTNGPAAEFDDGDWWTNPAYGNSPHIFWLEIPKGVNPDFVATIQLWDPESFSNNPESATDSDEEKSNGWEATTFSLYAPDNTLIASHVYEGGDVSTSQKWVKFYDLRAGDYGPGMYKITVAVAGDDENGYKIGIEDGNADKIAANGNEIKLYAQRTAFQFVGEGSLTNTFWFNVSKRDVLRLFNFDLEKDGCSVKYISPSGVEYPGTLTEDGSWNTDPPSPNLPLNGGGDLIENPEPGWWQAVITTYHPSNIVRQGNQFIFWPDDLLFNGPPTIHRGLIGDRIWLDANQNGLQDKDETGIANATVRLLDGNTSEAIRTTTTDLDGLFLFSDVAEGNYRLEYQLPQNFFFTAPRVGGNREVDSDADPNTGRTGVFYLKENESRLNLDAGMIPKHVSNLTVTKSVEGGDLELVPGEEATFDITVTNKGPFEAINIRVVDKLPAALELVNVDRHYDAGPDPLIWIETSLAAGESRTYKVKVKATSVLGEVENCVWVSSPNKDEDLTDNSSCVILRIQQEYPNPSGIRIGDRVWIDSNNNGLQDAGEPGMDKVTVHLLSGVDQTLVQSDVTNAEGAYLFKEMPAGAYLIEFVLPEGYAFAKPDQGSNDDLDSDVDQVYGKTPAIFAMNGGNYPMWDAGLVPYIPPQKSNISIGDRVWKDLNRNGIQDEGEPGMPGITVNLLSGLDESLVLTSQTDADGLYLFKDMAPGSYLLQVVQPADYDYTLLQQGGDPAADSDIIPESGKSAPFSVVSNAAYLGMDAGFVPFIPPVVSHITIGDRIWKDLNHNGLQEEGEPGLPGIIVNLLSSLDESLVLVDTTDSDGFYLFKDMAPGSYRIQVVQPAGYLFTLYKAGSDPAADSDIAPESGKSAPFTVAANTNYLTLDGGLTPYVPPVKSNILIGDRVWNDLNQNGQQDANEPGMAHVTVRLVTGAAETAVDTTTTDADGFYSFADMAPGVYRVVFSLPAGFFFTIWNSGDDAMDSDANPVNGRTDEFSVESGKTYTGWDAGVVENSESDLEVAKIIEDSRSYFYRGDSLTFVITVTNHGPDDARGITLIDNLPDGLAFITAERAQDEGPNPLIWHEKHLAVGASVTYRVRMCTTDELGGMDNCVTVSSVSFDPDLANNIACAQVHILVPVELSSFTARSSQGKVILNWTTQSETENLGFHILRAESENGIYTRVNKELIQGAGTTSSVSSYSYTDESELKPSASYYYKLVDVDYKGRLNAHGPVNAVVEVPTKHALEQNYPNPFNPETRINFSLKEAGRVALTIYNVRGEAVRTLISGPMNAGAHMVVWDGRNDYGQPLPSGMYIYTMRVNNFEEKRTMMFLK